MLLQKIPMLLTILLVIVVPPACEIDDFAGQDMESDQIDWRATIGGNGLLGTYYNNSDFTAKALTRVDPAVNYDWGEGSPNSRIGRNSFSVRWTGFVEARYSETYTFYTISDDGVKLWVNDKLVISDWSDHAPRESSGKIGLTAGKRYSIKLEYYENGGGAVAKLLWSSPRQAKQTIPNTQLFVHAESSTENVARGKNTSQSSTSSGGISSRAVDGNTSGRWSNRSVTHTSNTSNPWWRVDLGSAYDVQSVTLFNRTDCCSDRLSDFHVDLLDKNGNVLAKKDFRGQANAKTDITITAAGVHAVRVQLYGRDPLSLAEVQVWAGTDDGGRILCAGANENSSATLSCPNGETISSIDFASYGLPTGLCGVGFEQGTCHASGSEARVEASCLNKQTCTVRASNGTFGDPCPGKYKRLAVAYRCTGDDVDDQCPNDPHKTEPGECGCGVPEADCDHQTPSQGRESYDGPWGGKHVKLRDVWKNNWSEGLSSREKYLLVSNNDCNQSRVKEHAQANGFLFLAQEGSGDSGATLLEVQGNSKKDGLKAILDVGKITITAVTTDGTLIPEGGGGDNQHDKNRMAFGSTDNTNTGGGVYHLDLQPQNEDGVTIWDRDHPCKSFRGGFMYLRWE